MYGYNILLDLYYKKYNEKLFCMFIKVKAFPLEFLELFFYFLNDIYSLFAAYMLSEILTCLRICNTAYSGEY